jgi:hypothetical protein
VEAEGTDAGPVHGSGAENGSGIRWRERGWVPQGEAGAAEGGALITR